MSHFALNTLLVLGAPTVVDSRGKRLQFYAASLELEDGTTMQFTITRSVDNAVGYPPNAHHTQAQVLGDADFDGPAMLVSNASIIESDAPADDKRRLPGVVFAGVVSYFGDIAFHVDIDTARSHAIKALCNIDWASPHFVDDVELPVAARVSVSGVITGMRGKNLCITVHDVRTDGSQPCPGHCLQHVPGLSAITGHKYCQWLAHQDREDQASPSSPVRVIGENSPSPLPRGSQSHSPSAARAPGNLSPNRVPDGEHTLVTQSPRYPSSSPHRSPVTPVAPRSPVAWDDDTSPNVLAEGFDAQVPQSPRYPSSSPYRSSVTPVASRSPVAWDDDQCVSIGQNTQVEEAVPDADSPPTKVVKSVNGACKQQRMPPSPGPHKRSYRQWSNLRVESTPF